MSTPQGPQQPGPPPFPQQPPPAQPKRKPFGWVAMIIATASALAIGSCMGGVAGVAGSGAPQATVTEPGPTVTVTQPGPTVTVTQKAEAPAEKKEEEPPKEEPAGLGDGTYEVGEDIKPGRYKTVVPADSANCYWARMKDDSGELDAIIANENNQPGARVSVTIKKSDGFFKSTGCGDWQKS